MTERIEDLNGYIEIEGNPISRVGVFPYSGAQIKAPGLDPNKVYYIYRSEEELSDPECIESFKLIPWIEDHELLGKKIGLESSEKKKIEGVIGEKVYYEDGLLKANLKIFTKRMEDVVSNDKKELSIGYQCKYTMTPGVFNGQYYDGVQTDLRGNHLGSVREGRSGPDVSVLDAFIFTFDSGGILNVESEKEAKAEMTLETLAEKLMALEEKISKFMAEDDSVEEREESSFTKEEPQLDEVEEEKETKKIEDEDMSKGKYAAMDEALFAKKIFKEISQCKKLADSLSKVVGVFDHAEKNLNDIAAYGVKKLGLTCQKGHEITAVESYLKAYNSGKNRVTNTVVMDSKPAGTAFEQFSKYLEGA